MNKKLVLPILYLLALPSIAFGQFFPTMPSLTSGVDLLSLITIIASLIINATWIVSVAFVIIMFVVAGFKFVTAQGDPSKVSDARNAVIWGVGGIIVILLAFSILVVLRITLGV